MIRFLVEHSPYGKNKHVEYRPSLVHITNLFQYENYKFGQFDLRGVRLMTIEAAREDHDLNGPVPPYSWEEVQAKYNGGMYK